MRSKPVDLPKEFSRPMKRSIVLSLLLAVALVPFVTAQTPAAPAKIAVISFQEALAATNEGQRDVADLQKKFEPKRVQFKTMAGEIDTLTRQLQSDGGKLTDE